MKLFKWFQNKAGKLPVTVAQAAGLTAVVGAAGLAAISYLGGPSDNNNTFVPPSAYEQGDVVYVAQGPGSYDADGAAGSTFKAAPSRSIQLANQQDMQLRRAQELEGFTAQPAFEDPLEVPTLDGKAHELSGGERGLGMGGNKQIGNSFEILQNMPDQLTGLNDVLANAQKAAAQAGGANGAGVAAPGANTSGGSDNAPGEGGAAIPTLARATLSGGPNGAPRAGGGGSGSGSTFVVQNSGKNPGTRAAGPTPEEMAQAGNAIEQARTAMTRLREGETLKSQANFGPSGGLSGDRDAMVQKGRNFGGQGRTELSRIRKHMEKLQASNTLRANAVAEPYMANGSQSAGMLVNTDNVFIGQNGASSGDFRTRAPSRAQMKGIQARLDQEQAKADEREAARDALKSWMIEAFFATLGMSVAISILVRLAKGPWAFIFYAAAAVLTAAALTYIWWGAIQHITEYNGANGSDTWSILGWVLAGVFSTSIGLAWFVYPQWLETGMSKLTAVSLALVGLGGVGMTGKGIFDLADKGKSTPTEETDESHQTADEEE